MTQAGEPPPLTILCIDDEPDMLHLIHAVLLHDDHHVYTALNGDRGLSMLSRLSVDIVMVNYLMPRVSGMEVVEVIAAERRLDNVGVIFYTAVSRQQLPVDHPAWPRVDVCLLTPFHPRRLLVAVREAHKRRHRSYV